MANEYWRRRAAEYEREWSARCESELERELARYFRESLSEIEKDIAALYGKYMKDNALSYREARRLIRGSEFAEWRMSLRDYVAAARTDSAVLKELNTLAMRSRITRLEKLYSETLRELQRLGERSESAVRDFLTTAYRERYYHGIYDLAKVGKLAVPVSKVEPARLEKVLAQRWQGGNYSTRIWKDTERLSKVLKQTITSGLHRGLSVEKMSKAIDREMNAGYKNAERLVRTEMNFVQNHAAKESLESAGLREYEFIAVLDHRTSQRCQNLDGTVHLLEEYDPGTNAPPMHPRCRSTISAVVEGGTRTAKVGGRNIRVPADMHYHDFKRVYVDKSLTLKDWTAARGNDKISTTVKGITAETWRRSRKLSEPVTSVKDAKSFAEFQTYWAENYNVRVSDELRNLDFKAVQEAARGIETVLQDFPNAARMLKELSVDSTHLMSTAYEGRINFHPERFKHKGELEKAAAEDAKSGFHPKNTGIREYGAHEAAHILIRTLIDKNGGNKKDWNEDTYAWKVILKAWGSLGESVPLKSLMLEISKYSITNASETLAEAVSDYVRNTTEASRLSRAIYCILKKELTSND